jgi:hypothetical protein
VDAWNEDFDNSRRLSPEELDAVMRANDHRKVTAYAPNDRPRSKAAEAQDVYRGRQQAKARDQFNVTTTTDPLKRVLMRRCIQAIEYTDAEAAALQAVLDDPEVAALATEIRSRRQPDGAAQTNDSPEASGPGHVAGLVRALLGDVQLCDLVHELLKCDRAPVSAIAQALASPRGLQLSSRVLELDEEQFAGLSMILNHHQRGPLIKHCARHGLGTELLTGIYHPEAPALGRRLQELPRFWRWLFDRVTPRLY